MKRFLCFLLLVLAPITFADLGVVLNFPSEPYPEQVKRMDASLGWIKRFGFKWVRMQAPTAERHQLWDFGRRVGALGIPVIWTVRPEVPDATLLAHAADLRYFECINEPPLNSDWKAIAERQKAQFLLVKPDVAIGPSFITPNLPYDAVGDYSWCTRGNIHWYPWPQPAWYALTLRPWLNNKYYWQPLAITELGTNALLGSGSDVALSKLLDETKAVDVVCVYELWKRDRGFGLVNLDGTLTLNGLSVLKFLGR